MKATSTHSFVLGAALASGTIAMADAQSDTPLRPAQNSGTEHELRREMKTLTHRLKLTSEQQSQIRPVLEEREGKLQTLRNDNEDTSAHTALNDRFISRKEQMATAEQIQDANDKIEGVLDTTQIAKFEKDLQAMQARMQRTRDEDSSPEGFRDSGPPDGSPGSPPPDGGGPPPGGPPEQ
jgi:periplasmic protein CpxP/Spy